MKTVHIIPGVLVLLLFMVGSASATTFYLTNTSEDVSGIRIAVTFNGTHITVQDASPILDGVSNVGIKSIGLYLANSSVGNVTNANSQWIHQAIDHNVSEFGDFQTMCSITNPSIHTEGPIVIELKSRFTKLPENEFGNSIVVHLRFGDKEIDVGSKTVDSSWVGGGDIEIPEFSSIAVPVVAILGLLFISGRRRKE